MLSSLIIRYHSSKQKQSCHLPNGSLNNFFIFFKYESATDLYYVLSLNTCFFIIFFPPEFLPASRLTERWCASTLGAALITPGYFTHFFYWWKFLFLLHVSIFKRLSCICFTFHVPSLFHVFTCHPISWLQGYHQGAASTTI